MKIDLKKTFKESAKNTLEIGLSPSFWIFAVVAGLAAYPLSATVGIAIACAPATYTAIGLTYKGISMGLDAVSKPSNP